ncbi:MAG TPA: molybdopterin-dependent oxidoreductase, partial [Candidatus Binatia bacterium]|nr:molybdopterin-dependent oxidoreductase [Candidatus Binatia bacterium]
MTTAQARAAATVTLPMENGTRPLVAFPQKRPLIVLTPRPPQLETPFQIFDEGILTPNDAFYVRWHLSGIPATVNGATHRIRVDGLVKHPMNLSIEDLRTKFPQVEVVAVNECSGNSRGLFSPRVAGGQWDNGAMGNARWTGVRLSDILAKAGLRDGVRQIRFSGLEKPPLPATPAFVKALSIEDVIDNGDILVAYEMNGAPLPLLNGYPVRLVVPGWYGTYWMKMLDNLEAIDTIDDNFWMKTAYRIPETPGNTVKPTDTGYKTVPINKLTVRSFVTNVQDGGRLRAGPRTIRGIAFDGGSGIKAVQFSSDGGQTWHNATLGEDYGRYS